MPRINARLIVGAFGAVRMAIGTTFLLAPARLGRGSNGAPTAILMTRSFAVREAVLGAGGLLAARDANASPPAVQTWAGLGALTDAGDLAASVAAVRRGDSSARLPAFVAAVGLVTELWALRTAGGRSQRARRAQRPTASGRDRPRSRRSVAGIISEQRR